MRLPCTVFLVDSHDSRRGGGGGSDHGGERDGIGDGDGDIEGSESRQGEGDDGGKDREGCAAGGVGDGDGSGEGGRAHVGKAGGVGDVESREGGKGFAGTLSFGGVCRRKGDDSCDGPLGEHGEPGEVGQVGEDGEYGEVVVGGGCNKEFPSTLWHCLLFFVPDRNYGGRCGGGNQSGDGVEVATVANVM